MTRFNSKQSARTQHGAKKKSSPAKKRGRSNAQSNRFKSNSYSKPVTIDQRIGILELHPNGYGFLRDPDQQFARTKTDPFVSASMIEQYDLREGNLIRGQAKSQHNTGPRIVEVLTSKGTRLTNTLNQSRFQCKNQFTPIARSSWNTLCSRSACDCSIC